MAKVRCKAFVDRTNWSSFIHGTIPDPSGTCDRAARVSVNGIHLCLVHTGKAAELLARRSPGLVCTVSIEIVRPEASPASRHHLVADSLIGLRGIDEGARLC